MTTTKIPTGRYLTSLPEPNTAPGTKTLIHVGNVSPRQAAFVQDVLREVEEVANECCSALGRPPVTPDVAAVNWLDEGR